MTNWSNMTPQLLVVLTLATLANMDARDDVRKISDKSKLIHDYINNSSVKCSLSKKPYIMEEITRSPQAF